MIDGLKKIDLKYWFIFFGAYLFFSGVTFAAFSSFVGTEGIVSPTPPSQDSDSGEATVFAGPRDQECPINGAMYTKEEKKIWETRKPLLMMVENHEDSRPQSGLSRADVIYEAVAEGGITRFMGVYYCGAVAPAPRKYDVGPVRSARTYFLDWASEYAECPLYNHVGGANCSAPPGGACTTNVKAQALEQIRKYGWLGDKEWCDLSYMALGYKQCRREPERTGEKKATEHTVYCDTPALWQKAEDREVNEWGEDEFQPWQFKDEAKEADRGSGNEISLYFWKGYSAYGVTWKYDRLANNYLRINGGKEQKDFLTGKPLTAKVVVVQFVKETGPVDEHKHLLYGTTGKGGAIIFQDGEKISGTWEKAKRLDRTIFYDSKGKEVEFNRGLIWIEVLPRDNKVTYGSEQKSE